MTKRASITVQRCAEEWILNLSAKPGDPPWAPQVCAWLDNLCREWPDEDRLMLQRQVRVAMTAHTETGQVFTDILLVVR